MLQEHLIQSFDQLSTLWGIKTNGMLLIAFVVSLPNPEWNQVQGRGQESLLE